MRNKPLVSIVTPVYNGEKFIAECIQSVLEQTYTNWNYVIVNNCSTDKTLKICRVFEEKDDRIKVIDCKEFFDMIPNWNRAIDYIDQTSSYFKIIQADDIIYPNFLEKTIAIAESNQRVGIVSSLILLGNEVKNAGLLHTKSVVSGSTICKATLNKEYFLFGSPSSLLFKTETLKMRKPFYDKTYFHADTELCYFVLKQYDFGFVNQVLSYTRIHYDSQTETFGNKFKTNLVEYLGMLKYYGPLFLDENEFKYYFKQRTKKYYRILANDTIRKGGLTLLKFHKKKLESFDLSFELNLFFISLIFALRDIAIHPKNYILKF